MNDTHNILTLEGLHIVGKRNQNINQLKRYYASVSTRAVLVTLSERYGASEKIFFWRDRKWTPRQALKEWQDYLLNIKCSEFGVVRFFGGPPRKSGWYNGTVLTMLLDLLLFRKTTEDWDFQNKLDIKKLIVPPFE